MGTWHKHLICITVVAAAPCAMAAVSGLDIGFNASGQSLWGGGPAAQFKGSGDTGGSFAAWYDYVFSTGVVEAQLGGSLFADHASAVAPGSTTIGLGFQGSPLGGHLESTFGGAASAGVRVDLDFPWYVPLPDIHVRPTLASVGIALHPDTSFTPVLGQSAMAQDEYKKSLAGFDIVVASASLDLGLRQQSTLGVQGIGGMLNYTLRGSGQVFGAPVFIDGDGTQVSVNLDKPGMWDFSYTDLSLFNTLATGFDLTLGASVDSWFGGWSTPSLPMRLVNVPNFALDFNEVSTPVAFTIAVQVPEPSTYALFGAGLALVAWAGQRRRAG